MKPARAHRIRSLTLAIAAALALHGAAFAESTGASELSEASLVPVAISVALPIVLVEGVGSVVVTGVETSAQGTVWVIENVADGVQGSIRFAGKAVGASAVVVGTVVMVTVVATGMLLSAAGHVIAFIPNEIGRSLSYNQRVSQ